MSESPHVPAGRPCRRHGGLLRLGREHAHAELVAITRMVNHMPAFATYDPDRIQRVSRTVFDLFEEEDGLDALFGLIREALPERLYETAYALACDVVTADGRHSQVELRMLEEVREELKIDRLHAAAIEWGARVRHMGV